mmetsp:Transcript_13518/g.15845  ORF Transcript_13518/g.15845 Transcript_13518/m.15845 type:complete len:774 (-) Transcript_13518:280-2601(-)
MATTGYISFEEGWGQIRVAIDRLKEVLADMDEVTERDQKKAHIDKETHASVYTICYNMCTQKHGGSGNTYQDLLYEKHGEVIAEYLQEEVQPSLRGKQGLPLMKEVVKMWKRHAILNKWMKKIFLYLDRYHVKAKNLPTLNEASLAKFKELVFDVVKQPLANAMLDAVNREREGELVDADLFKECVVVFGAMGNDLAVYKEAFQKPFLEQSQAYYRKKSQEWMQTDSTPEYLIKAEKALKEEEDRVNRYLEKTTMEVLLKECQIEILQVHETSLLEKSGSGCRAMLEQEKNEHLSLLFRLYENIERGLEPIAKIVKEHIARMGSEIITQRESALKVAAVGKGGKQKGPSPSENNMFVEALLDLHDKFRALVVDNFFSHTLFEKALKEAFEVFVNHDVGKMTNAELISTYCDRILQNPGNENEMDEKLSKAVQLFSYLSDKDLFSEIYRNQLAKRILIKKKSTEYAEKAMIAKLKVRCGAQFTGKMEGMVKDLLTGETLKQKFRQYIRDKNPDDQAMNVGNESFVAGIDFSVDLLTTGWWPNFKKMELKYPENMTRCMEVYQNFYQAENNHRQIKWLHSLGQATVKGRFNKGDTSFFVTTLQAVCLILFNGHEPGSEESGDGWLEFQDIHEQLGCGEDMITKRVLHSLSCGKYPILKKSGRPRKIDKTDKFAVNIKFHNKKKPRGFKIPMPSLEESHNPKKVEDDRSIAIEAAIVRIMKARKTLEHQELMSEVLRHLHFFSPVPRTVKRRIEHLIEREYLRRDENNPSRYIYIS